MKLMVLIDYQSMKVDHLKKKIMTGRFFFNARISMKQDLLILMFW